MERLPADSHIRQMTTKLATGTDLIVDIHGHSNISKVLSLYDKTASSIPVSTPNRKPHIICQKVNHRELKNPCSVHIVSRRSITAMGVTSRMLLWITIAATCHTTRARQMDINLRIVCFFDFKIRLRNRSLLLA